MYTLPGITIGIYFALISEDERLEVQYRVREDEGASLHTKHFKDPKPAGSTSTDG